MVQSDTDRKAFSDRLDKACAKAGYDGRGKGVALSKLFRVSEKAVSKWINGESIPRREKIAEMARVLDVDRQWLEYGIGSMEHGVTDVPGLSRIVDLGLSDDSLKLLEEHAYLLKLREQETGRESG